MPKNHEFVLDQFAGITARLDQLQAALDSLRRDPESNQLNLDLAQADIDYKRVRIKTAKLYLSGELEY